MPHLQGLNLHDSLVLTERVKTKLVFELDKPQQNLFKVACHATLLDSLIDTILDLSQVERKLKMGPSMPHNEVEIDSINVEIK